MKKEGRSERPFLLLWSWRDSFKGGVLEAVGFGQRLLESVEAKRSHVVVGLDPDYELLPALVVEAHPRESYGSQVEMEAACYRDFLMGLLPQVADHAVAIKIQIAYFETLGAAGWQLYEDLVRAGHDLGLLVIADVKRGDIGKTAEAYAVAHLDRAGVDAMTVNPYLGSDSVQPFLQRARGMGKGVFVLVKTSNPSSAEIQDLEVSGGGALYGRVAELVSEWGLGTRGDCGYASVGAVVGGTHPQEGRQLRALMPGVPLLVPGYGAQGAVAEDLGGFFDEDGTGAVVNSSRGIIYAYRSHPDMGWQDAARLEVETMRAALWKAARHGG